LIHFRERAMTTNTTDDRKDDPKAGHGYRNEVSWNHGQGSQPYQNQGEKEQGPPNGGDEFAAGDRGDLSGNNADQMDRARGVPD
jgi:hypothetical protein